jgi:hypothetical protein
VDLLTHYAEAIAEVLATTKTASSTSSNEDDSSWAGADFSKLDDPGALRCFVGIYDNLLDNGDSDDRAHVAITLEGGGCAWCRHATIGRSPHNPLPKIYYSIFER